MEGFRLRRVFYGTISLRSTGLWLFQCYLSLVSHSNFTMTKPRRPVSDVHYWLARIPRKAVHLRPALRLITRALHKPPKITISVNVNNTHKVCPLAFCAGSDCYTSKLNLYHEDGYDRPDQECASDRALPIHTFGTSRMRMVDTSGGS